MSEAVTFRRVADALQAILEEEVPEVPWRYEVLGPVFPKDPTGFIACDEMNYKPFNKGDALAEATFGIQIIYPNPNKQQENAANVEDLAVKVRRVLTNNNTLDGWAVDSTVERIVFGAAAGNNRIGTALLSFTVKYEE